MEAEGLKSDADMHQLSIMGFDGLLENIREILGIRRALEASLLKNPPDLFIGIDAPDFNLTLERRLKSSGIPTIHYVSPTVWAWRSYRIFKIRKAVDLMLTLFPFEADYYRKRNVPVEYVGHPLAKTLKPHFDLNDIHRELKKLCDIDGVRYVAVLPGSRRSEVEKLGDIFVQSIERVRELNPDVEFIIPLANERVTAQINEILERYKLGSCSYIHLIEGELSADAMRMSKVVLLASGTAALESTMLAKPTVVAYRLSKLTYWFAKLTSTVKHASMPNHLLDEPIVPEFLQENANPENLSQAVHRYLSDEELYKSTCEKLATIQPLLDIDSSSKAAAAVLKFLNSRP
jgi:lipid-A-disaccharide synthase